MIEARVRLKVFPLKKIRYETDIVAIIIVVVVVIGSRWHENSAKHTREIFTQSHRRSYPED